MVDTTDRENVKRDKNINDTHHPVITNRSSAWQPAIDAYESSVGITIVAELAGMKSGNFSVTLNERRLVITGKRTSPIDESSALYHQLEIPYGEFLIEIHMPWAVERDGVSASYEDGFLRIALPRRKQSHTIPVTKKSK